MANHLAGESSPYLLQHADNPVDWYPWGAVALERARVEDKPIFLSIGYSACHWCHVMERESFTDPQVAAFLNEHFVSIKVDREERPDLDAIYLQAVGALTGQGGWPLTVWLDPAGAPFYGGTYFPPTPRSGRPSLMQALRAVANIWRHRRNELQSTFDQIKDYLARDTAVAGPASRGLVFEEADRRLAASFDPIHGGWGEAPKFPHPLVLEYLLARHARRPSPALEAQITTTLDAMAAGGIYDHLGGGFHRYSTDGHWLVPHFEKMLYDNAQLARCYLHAYQLLGTPRYRTVAEETLDYLLDRMRHPAGGFFSSEDADSEGEEGAFYVWTADQLADALTPDEAALIGETYDVRKVGTFEGANVLHVIRPPGGQDAALAAARAKLLAARERRVRPVRDEKIITGWNGLALTTLAEAARALHSERYREAAIASGTFITERLARDDGRLARSWKDGRASGNAFLKDYVCTIEGLLALYQATFAESWFTTARILTDAVLRHFGRPAGGFFDTSDDHEVLIIRPRTLQDSPTPCGNSLGATVLLKMAAYTGEAVYGDRAGDILASAGGIASREPVMFGQWLSALLMAGSGLTEVALVGIPADPLFAELRRVVDEPLCPALVVAGGPPGVESTVPLLHRREPAPDVGAAAWVCKDSVCSSATSDPEALRTLMAR